MRRLSKTEYNIEKLTSVCSDGKNLLVRLPKGNKIKWEVDAKTKDIKTTIIK